MSTEENMQRIHGCEDDRGGVTCPLTIWLADILVHVEEKRDTSIRYATDVLVKGTDETISTDPHYIKRICDSLSVKFKLYEDGKIKILEIHRWRRIGKALQQPG